MPSYLVEWSFDLRGSGYTVYDAETEAEAERLAREDYELNAGEYLNSVEDEEFEIDAVSIYREPRTKGSSEGEGREA